MIDVYSPAEAQRLLRGRFDLVCREPNGAVAWEVHQTNLVTDYGRRRFCFENLRSTTTGLFTSPSSEPPLIGRSVLADDGNDNSSQWSGLLSPTYNATALTKTFYFSFPTPTALRRIGTVGLGLRNATYFEVWRIIAYSLLNPAKTQTVNQTLELSYVITLNPVY